MMILSILVAEMTTAMHTLVNLHLAVFSTYYMIVLDHFNNI